MRNAYESRVDKIKRRGIVGELILAIAFSSVLVLKKLDGRIQTGIVKDWKPFYGLLISAQRKLWGSLKYCEFSH
jgi:hypothetical protein